VTGSPPQPQPSKWRAARRWSWSPPEPMTGSARAGHPRTSHPQRDLAVAVENRGLKPPRSTSVYG